MPLSAVQNTFAGNPLDRASDRRSDAAWIAAQLDSPDALVLALWNGSPLLEEGPEGPRLAYLAAGLARELAEADGLLFLGLWRETPVFALELDGSSDPAQGPLQGLGRFEDMRTAGALLSGPEGGIAATARAVFEWRRRHRFCSPAGTRAARATPAGNGSAPPAAPSTSRAPTRGDHAAHVRRALPLGRQAAWPPGRYSALAGFLEPGETIEEACAREIREESALETLSVRYHSSQPCPSPHP
jgi:NAD+ diphosphatase